MKESRVCQMCGERTKLLHRHHVIPRWLGGTNEDTIILCPSCHKKTEGKFMRYLLDPFGENGYGTSSSLPSTPHMRRYWREYAKKHYHYGGEYKKHKIEYQHKYYQKNRRKRINYQIEYYQKNKEKILYQLKCEYHQRRKEKKIYS